MQLVFDHLGNVAARCSWDLRKPEDGLCQQYIWSLEEQVPWLHEWGRTNNFAHKGNRNFIHSKLKPKPHSIYQDRVSYNAYEKDIAIVNIFFGESTVFGELEIGTRNSDTFSSRIWKISKNDLVGLHLWLRRDMWTLPWDQLCVSGWDCLLVHSEALQELLIFLSITKIFFFVLHVTLSVHCTHTLYSSVFSALQVL